jgi:hypothetical protein
VSHVVAALSSGITEAVEIRVVFHWSSADVITHERQVPVVRWHPRLHQGYRGAQWYATRSELPLLRRGTMRPGPSRSRHEADGAPAGVAGMSQEMFEVPVPHGGGCRPVGTRRPSAPVHRATDLHPVTG